MSGQNDQSDRLPVIPVLSGAIPTVNASPMSFVCPNHCSKDTPPRNGFEDGNKTCLIINNGNLCKSRIVHDNGPSIPASDTL